MAKQTIHTHTRIYAEIRKCTQHVHIDISYEGKSAYMLGTGGVQAD